MCLMQHSLRAASEIKRTIIDTNARNQEVLIAKMIQCSIENWVKRMSSNRIDYPRIRGGLLGYDADSIALLVQSGHDLAHCIDEKIKEESTFIWCRTEAEDSDIKIIKHHDEFLPYWASFSMPPQLRKSFHIQYYEKCLLGNSVFHHTSCHTPDTILSPGSLIGPFVWCAPNCSIGVMATLAAHVAVASDVAIGDYCQIEQNVSIGAGARIGECCSIGQGAIIWQGVKIAPNVRIQPGQIVKTDIVARPFTFPQ